MTTPHPGPKCGRTTRASGTCGQAAGWGTDHPGEGPCKLHGGKAPQVERAYAVRRVEAELRAAAADLLRDAPPVDNPLALLLKRLGEIDAWLGIIRDKAADLADAEALTYRTETGDVARAIVTLYERALDRAVNAAAKIAALQIDDRMTAIVEREVAALERAVEAAWAAGRDGADLDAARAEAGRHLSVVA
jgi:hypothetical protein